MNRWTRVTRRRAILATVLLSAAVVTVFVLSIPTEAAPSGNCTYYSNGSYTTVVGKFGKDCCNNNVAWGIKTKFSRCGGCFICYPPPQ